MKKILIKEMGRNLSGHIFIGLFYTAEASGIIILLNLFGKLFPWDGVNGVVIRLYSNTGILQQYLDYRSTINIYG